MLILGANYVQMQINVASPNNIHTNILSHNQLHSSAFHFFPTKYICIVLIHAPDHQLKEKSF